MKLRLLLPLFFFFVLFPWMYFSYYSLTVFDFDIYLHLVSSDVARSLTL